MHHFIQPFFQNWLQNFPQPRLGGNFDMQFNSQFDLQWMRVIHRIGLTRPMYLPASSPWLMTATAAIITTITLLPKTAEAHGAKLGVQPIQAFEIQANYDSGDPMSGAQVQVFAPDEPQTAVLVGQTDKNGRWLWQPDRPGEWTLQVRQAGHGDIAHITVTESDLLTVNQVNSANSAIASASNSSAQTSINVAQVPAKSQAQGRVETEEDSLQRLVSIALVIWGAIGTALFFSRSSNEPQNPSQSDV